MITEAKGNFRNMYLGNLECNYCNECDFQSQNHILFECSKIISCCPDLFNNVDVEHEDIYGDVIKQLAAVKLISKILRTIEDLDSSTN